MKRLLILSLCAAAAIVIVIACAAVVTQYQTRSRAFYSDGGTIHVPTSAATLRSILWQPPVALPPTVNSALHDYEPCLSADGQSLYFVRGRTGGQADIWICHRLSHAEELWSEPELLSINRPDHDELGPAISLDGQNLYFYSDCSGGHGGYDLWKSHRDGAGWMEPVNCGSEINTEFDEYSPCLSTNGDRLYFASNRPLPGDQPGQSIEQWSATLRENSNQRDFDIYAATFSNGVAQNVQPFATLNTAANEGSPHLSVAGDFLYFTSDRPGGHGGFDLYRARLVHGDFQLPINLGSQVNSAANEMDPVLSMGGFGLHFSSDRANPNGSPRDQTNVQAQNLDYGIYYSASREVFLEEADAEPFDWASLANALMPSLLWLLLGLLLLFALLALLRAMQSGRLSVLARCVLASLAFHLLLLIFLTYWQVTTAMREAFDKRGTQIALTSNAVVDDLSTQIRSGLTDVSISAPATPPLQQQEAQPLLHDANQPPMQQLPAESTLIEVVHTSASSRETLDASMPIQLQIEVAENVPLQALPTDVAVPAAASMPQVNESILEPAPPAPVESPRMKEIDSTPHKTGELVMAMQPEIQKHSELTPTNVELPAPSETIDHVDHVSVPVSLKSSRPMPALDTAIDVAVPVAITINANAEPSLNAPSTVAPTAAMARQSEFFDATSSSVAANLAPARMEVPDVPLQLASVSIGESTPNHTLSTSAVDLSSLPLPAAAPLEVATPLLSAASTDASVASGTEANIDRPFATTPHGPASIARAPMESDRTQANSESVALPPERSSIADHLATVPSLKSPPNADEKATASSITLDVNVGTITPALAAATFEVALPTAAAPPTASFAQRQENTRRELVEKMGGSEATERAVALALQWLAAHQSADGRWAAKRFDEHCGECRGPAKFETDIATTALALLCFFGADHTHQKTGQYQDHVSRGLKWLLTQQKANGDLRGNETMYSHGIASIAISEAFGMTRDPNLQTAVQRAVDIISAPANLRAGGWRYDPGQSGDTSVLGWQVMALVSAQRAGIAVSPAILEMARMWLDQVSNEDKPGLYAYQPGHRHTPSMTAEAMFSQQLLGMPPDQPRMQGSADYVMQNLPRWRSGASTYYWYYATLAMFQHQGEQWLRWNEVLTDNLLANQRVDGSAAGSWDPNDNWSKIGGRIYQTALCTLSLEVYYRYLPMYAQGGRRAAAE